MSISVDTPAHPGQPENDQEPSEPASLGSTPISRVLSSRSPQGQISEFQGARTLESPLDSKEIQPVNPKRIKPEYSLEGLMLKQKLQYFDHLMRRADSLEKTLMLEKIKGRRRREQ